MKIYNHSLLYKLQSLYRKINLIIECVFEKETGSNSVIYDGIEAKSIIRAKLDSDEPCMICRFGSNELQCICNYLGVVSSHKSYIKFVKGEINEWWWRDDLLKNMYHNAGFFPADTENLKKYAQLCLNDIPEIDILGSWLEKEKFVNSFMSNDIKRVKIRQLEPDWYVNDPSQEWTQCLKGKRVLVVHPFVETIKDQYKNNRRLLFASKNLLPEFELKTLKAVQSVGGNTEFKTWFDALEWMEEEMGKIEYDVALIGCGAYGFNLAAYAKRSGKKAIHLGGATQLLFGIIGKRWEERDYYKILFNQYWVRPKDDERPRTAEKIENGCYW